DLAVQEEEACRRAILDYGCELAELDADGRQAFMHAIKPVYGETRRELGADAFRAVETQRIASFA
ncbi:MAG TPA: hypothetical protein VHG27_06235, partial [Xanthobacteraceae bacterium]|nr:hypothetical protein [Xanthobacteraceae bacterium]